MRLFGFRDQKSLTSDPSTPSSGFSRYFTKFGLPFVKKDTGIIYPMTIQTPNVNVISNPNDADTFWSASGAGITVSTTSTSSDLPLEGVIPTAIKITPVSGSDYVYGRWTMPKSLKSQSLFINLYQKAAAGYADNDLSVQIWTNTASNYAGTYAQITLDSDAGIKNITGNFSNTFTAGSLDYYEIRIVRSAGTSAMNICLASIGKSNAFNNATATTYGLVKGGNVPGLISGSATSAGYIGEIISSGALSTTSVASSTYVDVTGASLTLTAGIWLINANFLLRVDQSGSGVIACGLYDSSNTFQGGNATLHTNDGRKSGKSFTVYKNISTTTTYKLRIASSGATSSLETADQVAANDAYSAFYGVRIG